MSKTFNGTTDLINLGSPAALDNLRSPITIVAHIYPTGWGEGNFGRVYDKSAGSALVGAAMWLQNSGTLASFALTIQKATTAAQGIAVASTLALNAHRFLAGTYVSGGSGPQLYVGSLSAGVAEVASYANRTDGVGAFGDDSAVNATIGNRPAADRTFDGRIAHLSLWDQALTIAQLDLLRLFPYAPMHRFSVGGTVVNLKGYWPLWESAAATCLDHSGNGSNGTVTGTSVGAEPPYTFTRRGTRATIWTPAVAGGRIWSLAGKGGGLVWTPRGLAH